MFEEVSGLPPNSVVQTVVNELARRERVAEEKETLSKNLTAYVRQAWASVEPSTTYVHGFHIDAICEHLAALTRRQIRNLIITIPPRHSKSLLCSVFWPTWVWTHEPSFRFLCMSYGAHLSLRDALKSRRLIQSSWYQDRWSDVFTLTGDQNAKMRYENNFMGYRVSSSVGGLGTGEGGDCLPAGEAVLTPDGCMDIEEIRRGDAVLAFDHERWKVVKGVVVATVRKTADAIYTLRTSSGNRLRCTGDHKVFVANRGYIRADQLVVGDKTIRHCDAYSTEPALRQLQQTNPEVALRSAQGAQAGKSGRILQQILLSSASCEEKFQRLLDLWWQAVRKTQRILFSGMPGSFDGVPAQAQALSEVRSFVRWVECLLFLGMRGQDPFGKNDRGWEFSLSGVGAVFGAFQKDEAAHSGAGQQSMRNVRQDEDYFLDRRSKEKLTAYPSSGRRYEKQCAGEPAHPLQWMSQKTPSWDVEEITFIEKDGCGEVPVYDIQVAGCHNFFAQNILVHNCISVDDPINLDEVQSDVIREGVNEWWDQVMSTRLNDPKKGVRLIIMQRGHETDLAGHLLKKGGWEHLNLPAEYELDKRKTSLGWSDPRTKAGQLICPERFGQKEIDELKATLGPYGASAQLQQRPSPAEGGIFKRPWFQLWPHDVKLPIFDYIIQSYDTAFTEQTHNDESASTVWGVFQHPKLKRTCVFLVDCWHDHMEYPALRKKVREDLRAKYGEPGEEKGVDLVLVEEKGSGITLLQDLRMIGVPAYGYNPTRADKVVRAHAVAPFFFAGLVYVLESGKRKGQPVSWTDVFIHQMLLFPNGDKDDMVDTATQTFIFLRNKEMIAAKVGTFEEDEPQPDPEPFKNPYSA